MMHPTQSTGIVKFFFKAVIAITEWYGKHYPESLVSIRYYVRFKKKLNLKKPKTLNEKILYLSLRTDTTLWTKLADKNAVRDYVYAKGLDSILIKKLGLWKAIEDIDIKYLPNKFVLKTTHGSGDVFIVTDKRQTSNDEIKSRFKPYLNKRYGALEGGIHYLKMEPALIAEELIVNDNESKLYSTSIIDYKIWCFNGKPYYIWVCSNRNGHSTDVMTYDTHWDAHPEYSIFNNEYRKGEIIPKPKNFDKMLDIASKLADNQPVVRVDLYNINGNILFGEMTFTSLGGLMDFYTDDFQNLAGSLIKI